MRAKTVKIVEYIQVEFETSEVDFMLLFLDKARIQMICDGSNTAINIAMLNDMEQMFHTTAKGR